MTGGSGQIAGGQRETLILYKRLALKEGRDAGKPQGSGLKLQPAKEPAFPEKEGTPPLRGLESAEGSPGLKPELGHDSIPVR